MLASFSGMQAPCAGKMAAPSFSHSWEESASFRQIPRLALIGLMGPLGHMTCLLPALRIRIIWLGLDLGCGVSPIRTRGPEARKVGQIWGNQNQGTLKGLLEHPLNQAPLWGSILFISLVPQNIHMWMVLTLFPSRRWINRGPEGGASHGTQLVHGRGAFEPWLGGPKAHSL